MSAIKSVLAKLGVSAAVAAVDQAVRHHVSDWWEKKKLEKQVSDETFEGVSETTEKRPATTPFDAIRNKVSAKIGQLRSPKPVVSHDAADEFKQAHLAADDDEPEIEP